MGAYKNAHEDYRIYSKMFDTIFDIAKVKEIREIELNYKYEREKLVDSLHFEEEKKILAVLAENEKVKRKLNSIIYLGILLLVSVFGFYSIRYFKKRWKASNAEQIELNKKLQLTKSESKKRLDVLNSDIEGLTLEIDTRKEEITALMTESLQHIKTKEKLVGDLKKLASNDDEISVQNIITDLKSEAIEDSRLLMIKNHLEELNYEFFKKIKIKHPNLTKVDLEICSYLKLDLGRKEIAQLRFTSIEAVRKSRHRLRKKMNLSLDDDLEDYIKSI
jgi:hypothetical protein